MPLRIATFLLLFLTVSLQAAPRQSKAMRELTKIPAYLEGASAMADALPDLAISSFRSTLSKKNLSPNARAIATLSLAKALIQSSARPSGNEQLANEALVLLEDQSVKELSDTPMWKAKALSSLGRYQEAESTLASVDQHHPRLSEIQLTRARLSLALAQSSHALNLLHKLAKSPAPIKLRNSANLLAAEIYIDQGKLKIAQKLLDQMNPENPSVARLQEYLKAQVALAAGQQADAIRIFQSLIKAPDHLSNAIFHSSILGLADAQTANNQTKDAISTLMDHVATYPESPVLQLIFLRLSQLIPPDLPNDNPVMTKLSSWCKDLAPTQNILYIVGDSSDAIPPYRPAPSEFDDRYALALHLKAKLLARSKSPSKFPLAQGLFLHLRIQHPAHRPPPPSELYMQLASSSLIDTAELQFKQKQIQQAAYTLEAMEKIAYSPRLKDQASLLRGILLSQESKYNEALAAFKIARDSSSEDIAIAANINSGITALLSNNLKEFNQIFQAANQAKIHTALQLEHALWKCKVQDPSARMDLDTFIFNHLGHPRENEARLALAAAAVDISPPDLPLANAQLDIITPRLTDADSQYAITRIRVRIDELIQNWAGAAATADAFIQKFSTDPRIPRLMLKQGEAYYHNEDFNMARRVFQSVKEQFPKSPFTPYASFYSAMAARLGGTTQAREESITLFQKIINSQHPLANEARIQQSRVLIDLRRYAEAQKALNPLLTSKKISISQRRDAGILMADCLHRQGDSDPKNYEAAIKIYDDLLNPKDVPLAKKHQLLFLRGQTLESMNRRQEALDSYYSVISQANIPSKTKSVEIEWFWFYRCGFKALSILEADKRWEAAVKLARRIASFDGPRAEEASKRADNLAKQHMIWEEEKLAPQAIELPNE